MLVSSLYTNRQPNCRPYGTRTHSSVCGFGLSIPLGACSSTTKLIKLIEGLSHSLADLGSTFSHPRSLNCLYYHRKRTELLIRFSQLTQQPRLYAAGIYNSVYFRSAIGEVDRIRTYGPHFCDQGISNPSHSTSLPLLQICFLCVMGLEPSPIGGRIKHICN